MATSIRFNQVLSESRARATGLRPGVLSIMPAWDNPAHPLLDLCKRFRSRDALDLDIVPTWRGAMAKSKIWVEKICVQ